MVTLAGAQAAQPFVTEILNLDAAVALLSTAIADNAATIWRMQIDYYDHNGVSHTILIVDNSNATDSAAIFNDIKNILANKVNIQTNSLGAIT